MKIGIDVSALGSKNTGTGRFINCLLAQLYNTQHTIEKFSPNIKNFSAPNEWKNKLRTNKHLYREFFFKNEFEKSGAECGIFPDYFTPKNFYYPAAIVIHDLSFITHPHFYSRKFVYYYKQKMKQTLLLDPLVCVVSENTKANAVKYLNLNEKNIFLLQGYADAADEILINHTEPYLLYVGHIEPRKNLLFMIRNFLLWKNTRGINMQLKLSGEFWIKSDETKNIISQYKDHPDVELLGYASDEELKKLYSNASGFVHTSFVEGFGFPVAEAMNYGLPILCSGGTACEEISFPYSITTNPGDDLSFLKGLDELYSLIIEKPKIQPEIIYSPERMQNQLAAILSSLEEKVYGKKIHYIPEAVSTEEAIEKTLLYSSIHNSGIHKELLHERLIDHKADADEINSSLIKLYLDSKILFKDDYIFSSHLQIYKTAAAKPKNHAEKLLKIIRSIPFISSIALSGGTAHDGIENHDDIDLFIITKKHTLYISYFLIHLLSLLFGSRKTFCANYLIDESKLAITASRDLYTAYQIISLKPIKNKELLNLFFFRNKWIQKYFPNFRIDSSEYKITSGYFLLSGFNLLLNRFYKNLYRKIIKSSGDKSIVINKTEIKLHTNDHRIKTLTAFKNEWEKYKSGRILMIGQHRKKAVSI